MQDEITEKLLAQISTALAEGQHDAARELVEGLHPADQAEIFGKLPEDQQQSLITELDTETTADILEELPEEEAAEIVKDLPSETLADVLDDMSPESAADILAELSPDQAASTLAYMEEAEEVTPLLQYPEDTAGGIMSPEVLSLDARTTIDECIQFLRDRGPDSETPYYLYVIDEDNVLLGVVGLRNLIVSSPTMTLEQIMIKSLIQVDVTTDQEEVARLMRKYNLLLLPVVETNGKLAGVIRAKQVVQIIEEEATEDIYRLSNLSTDGQLRIWTPWRTALLHRLPWLYLNLGTAFLAASVVSQFEETISHLAVLAVFQGIIAGQGGNAGTQTLALMVRGIAIGEISFKDKWRALSREAFLGLVQGALVGVSLALMTWAWKGNPWLGAVAGFALAGNMLAAGIAGTIVPLALRALKLDPALASAVLVTTVTDCVGFGLFLGLATLALPYL